MPRALRLLFATAIAALLVGGPVGYAWYRQAQIRNLYVVTEGVLYRSGQLSLSGLKRVLQDYRIKTVITLRDAADPGEGPPDLDENVTAKLRNSTTCASRRASGALPTAASPRRKGSGASSK